LSNWKHCEDQQKENILLLFPEQLHQKQFQSITINQSLFAVQHDLNHAATEAPTNPIRKVKKQTMKFIPFLSF